MTITHPSRRGFLGLSAGLVGTGLVPALAARAASRASDADDDPHFFLSLVYQPGWDVSYLFDARPLAMTAAGLAHNYLGEEPTPLTDGRGGSALVTSRFAPLKPHFDAGRFSILNGVHMAVGFDGHEQNMNYALTGNPFGGEAFMPHLNNGAAMSPLDYLLVGDLFGVVINNGARGVKLSVRSGAQLVKAVRAMAPVDATDPTMGFVYQRLAAAQAGNGALARGAGLMRSGPSDSTDLAERLKLLQIPEPPSNGQPMPLDMLVNFAHQSFVTGVSRSVVLTFFRNLDTHDADSAKQQPQTFQEIAADLAAVFEQLAATPLRAGDSRSLLDCTTVLVTSEFSRTLRQPSVAIDETGTDHNPLRNSVLLGGRGINGGLVIGASDVDTTDGRVSAAHKSLDESVVKSMGKPFDFSQMMATNDMPQAYSPTDYLTFASVANSLLRSFGVGEEHYWTLGRNLPVAPQLGPVLFRG